MTSNNFISSVDKSIFFNAGFLVRASSVGLSLVLSLSMLVPDNPVNYWFMPVVGTVLFALSLLGLGAQGGPGTTSRTDRFVDKPITAVTVTEFGRHNSANDEFIRTVA